MAVENLSPSKMVEIKVLSPSNLPKTQAGVKAKISIRVSANCIFLSKGLIDNMGLKTGDKIGFVKRNSTIYIYKTDSEDSYTIAGKSNEMSFSYKPLATVILETYGVLLLIENKTFTSQRFDVIEEIRPYMVAGVDRYWEIIAPKKYQSP